MFHERISFLLASRFRCDQILFRIFLMSTPTATKDFSRLRHAFRSSARSLVLRAARFLRPFKSKLATSLRFRLCPIVLVCELFFPSWLTDRAVKLTRSTRLRRTSSPVLSSRARVIEPERINPIRGSEGRARRTVRANTRVTAPLPSSSAKLCP